MTYAVVAARFAAAMQTLYEPPGKVTLRWVTECLPPHRLGCKEKLVHELRRFILDEMSKRGWDQAALSRASGLKPQTVNNLYNDTREPMAGMPAPATIAGLARAFGVPASSVSQIAVRALGRASIDAPVLVPTTDGVFWPTLAQNWQWT